MLLAGLLCAGAAPERLKSTRYGDYAPQVENLKAGRGFVDGEGRVLHRYPPLYPLMLWGLDGLGDRTGLPLYGVLAGFAIVCNAATAGIVWGMGRALGLGEWPAAAGAVVFGLHPFVLYGVLLPLSETPFMVLFAGGVLCLMLGMRRGGRRWFVWGDCCWGYRVWCGQLPCWHRRRWAPCWCGSCGGRCGKGGPRRGPWWPGSRPWCCPGWDG